MLDFLNFDATISLEYRNVFNFGIQSEKHRRPLEISYSERETNLRLPLKTKPNKYLKYVTMCPRVEEAVLQKTDLLNERAEAKGRDTDHDHLPYPSHDSVIWLVYSR